MKVVLTGGAGFIGSNLTRFWYERHPDDEVVVFDRLTYAGRRESIADLLEGPRCTLIVGDVADAGAVEGAFRDAELVVHLAAESHNDRAIAEPAPFIRTNVVGTSVVLEACRKLDIGRLHHVSTDEVFGSLVLGTGDQFTETSPYQPRSPYAASKAAADHLVRAWTATYGLRATISNSGNNYGPYQFPEKLIPLAITRLLTGGRVPLYGDGRQVRDWIHVADHCAAIDLVARQGTVGRTYLVSAATERSNRAVVESICGLLGASPEAIERVADRPGHDQRYALAADRIRDELGWAPAVPFDEGLARTVRWYRERSDWWRPLLTTASF